jgi:phytoene dehydrogenase-like protein
LERFRGYHNARSRTRSAPSSFDSRHDASPAELERRNPNLAGGDIGMGVTDLRQMIARPTLRWYRTPKRGLYICSASTPPGVGVHGMCGSHAATYSETSSPRIRVPIH